MGSELQFYCEDCELNFESEPDGTGYEQAPCPSCGDVCMTVAFHEEERQRSRADRAAFVSAVSPIVFTGYGFLVPLFCLACVVVTEITAEGITKDDEYYQMHAWPLAFAMACAGTLCLVTGKRLAERFEQADDETEDGDAPVPDTFFSVEMPYWGPILFVVALVSLFSRGL